MRERREMASEEGDWMYRGWVGGAHGYLLLAVYGLHLGARFVSMPEGRYLAKLNSFLGDKLK